MNRLKGAYIDAIYDYHEKGSMTMSNEEFDKLKKELNRRGSGFPSLGRDDVKFVEAYLAHARGEPIVSDDVYEEWKNRVKAKGRNKEINEFIFYLNSKPK